MAVELTFTTSQDCQNFANKHKLIATSTETIQVPWHLLNHAKNDPSLSNMLSQDTTEHEFIVKCADPSTLEEVATLVQDLGSNFLLVKSSDGVALSKLVDSIEITSLPVNFLDVATPENLNSEVVTIDPTNPENQWARLRVATRYRPLKSSFRTHDVTYASVPELYIMDTGINFSHPEFDDPNILFENLYSLPIFNENFNDDVGHGTAVTSLAVGKNLGIAAKCKVLNVKVGSSTHTATVFELGQAIDAIVAHASNNPLVNRIVNMSFGVTRSAYLDNKVQGMIDLGITVVCAAGNQGIDVELISPAGLDSVITVGSIDKFDIPSGFNNIAPSDSGLTTSYGLNLDIFAPGEQVIIAGINGYAKSSGTSFSAPLVSGVLTEIASLFSSVVSPTDMKKIMFDTATEHALLFDGDKFSDNQNRLIYLATTDENTNYKDEGMSSYLGVHGAEPNDLIVADLNSVINSTVFKKLFPEENFVFSCEFNDPDVGLVYQNYMNLDTVTGLLKISKPTNTLPAETKLKMIEFKAIVSSNKTKQESNNIFYFHANPLYAETLESDLSLALTETNSISFYGFWNQSIK